MPNLVELERRIHAPTGTRLARTPTALMIVPYALLLAAIALFAAIRFHLRDLPLERDAGEYAYMGQLMLQGVPPYRLAANMKMPGTYVAYAAIMAIFGQTPSGIHLGVIVVTSLSGVFLFLIGKRLYGPLTGAVAGASFIFFAARPGVLGIDGQATHFVNVMALAGILLLLYTMPRQGGKDVSFPAALFFASGLCFGLSFLMKQPGIFFGVFAGLYWLWHEWKHPIPRRHIATRGAALILGALLPYATICLLMLKAGVFGNFWFWTWTYAREYALLNKFHDGWRNLKIFFPWAVKPFTLWALALLGVLSPLWSRWARAHAGFVTGFLITSFLATCPGMYFRPHYFIVLLPVGALCIGIAVEWAVRSLQTTRSRALVLLPLLCFVLLYLGALRSQWKTFFRLDPATLSRKMYDPGQDFPADVTIADFIKARARPGDQVGVLGSEPEICFYTHLHCATSYIYMYPLMENQRFAKQMQSELERELESAPPRFLVYVDDSWSWNWKYTLAENRAFLDWTWNFAHSGYRLVDQLPVTDPGETEYLRGNQAQFYVFERTGD